METRKLAVFVDLAETCNYSRSAERLFLSQSTISKYILALEAEWQVQLFKRAHRQVTLTPAGQRLLPQVKAVLQATDQLQQAITVQQQQAAQSLVIRGLPSLPQYQAFHIITAFTKRYPQIKLHFSEASVGELTTALDDQTVDLVFTRIFNEAPAAYDCLFNESDQFVVLVPKDNPLAQRAEISLPMLSNESILLLKVAVSPDNPLFATLQKMRAQAQVKYDGQRIELILEMLNQGEGVSIVMARSFDLTGFDNIKAIPLVPKVTSRMAFMKRPGPQSAAVQQFWEFATTYTRQHGIA
ncbi:LysR family transcriptional regulator [Lactobacillus pentosus]|uniref:LysR family transcriptional regulator n=1 Tax=Lactiplantibacillus pentosus TaxID=1589 RepID=A0AB37RGX9_LACPE|nr:LysR family transcriptional regulator [Lactiplantibacillus pentosus]BBM20155.1 transcription regulator [Lactiplantibacillus plantarum]MCT3292884.1 LysR family transcriptional regulator [Lactiplantibacillus pentosus]MPQ18185.1 LysR family transcriptional regulator [Lactiplantibacillus pentosus]RMW41527.1 LysR family transcriptional regulator [Lactiplantibacillus pentosus]RMW42785.1 LysR family transcriptional regulator [Lactiplantibacillus pentosus]